jgi:hypothetical protein
VTHHLAYYGDDDKLTALLSFRVPRERTSLVSAALLVRTVLCTSFIATPALTIQMIFHVMLLPGEQDPRAAHQILHRRTGGRREGPTYDQIQEAMDIFGAGFDDFDDDEEEEQEVGIYIYISLLFLM